MSTKTSKFGGIVHEHTCVYIIKHLVTFSRQVHMALFRIMEHLRSFVILILIFLLFNDNSLFTVISKYHICTYIQTVDAW